MVEVDELVVVDELLLALRQLLGDLLGEGLLPRHELGVAAEQDVGAAAGHVGGDRDRAPCGPACATISASCAWYFAFRTTCLMPRRLSSRQLLGLLDRDRADERRAALPAASRRCR